MSLLAALMFYFPSAAFRRAAGRRLAASLPPETAAAIWRRARALRADLRTRRPRHSPGVDLIVRYLEWDLALYRAAQEHGVPKARAAALIEEIGWDVFGPQIKTAFDLSRLRSSRLRTRVRWVLDAMFFLIFTSPFRRRVLPSSDGLAFDVVACPLAAYFKEQGVPELTRHAACRLDDRMATQWGIGFNRSQTIAEGAPLCDFRFTLEKTGQ